MKTLFYISALILLVSSCKRADDLFKSYGKDITVERRVGSFTKINVGEKFDVELVLDSANEGLIELTAGSNVIDGYTTEVKNGELLIQNDNKFNWVRKLKVRQKVVVHFKNLNDIQIRGSAKFTCRDSIVNTSQFNIKHAGLEDAHLKIKGDYIFIDCTNTGGVNLSGSCFLLSASVDDISFVNSLLLNASKSYLTSFSKDDSYVKGNDVLEIKLYGTGSVYYRSELSTSLKLEDDGSGNILKY